jgi:gamma-glutamyl:cysteine ligase YbdK (ATP-grasp superfamily)
MGMGMRDRRLGLEQEFFLVDREGALSNRADEVLQQCWEIAPRQELSPNCFSPEFVKSMVEIKTSPVHTLAELTAEYLSILNIALQATQLLNLRLYPLSTYPLHITPVMRDKLNYHIQARTIGISQFENAAKCTGTHLHIELPAGVVDRRVAVSYDSTPAARAELLNLHNLATAFDPAFITLSRACPFYEGQVTGLAMRTAHYRGSEAYGW